MHKNKSNQNQKNESPFLTWVSNVRKNNKKSKYGERFYSLSVYVTINDNFTK